jgi:hypothetical protein
MSSFDGRSAAEEGIPVVKSYPSFGELVTGGSDVTRVMLTALCMLNDPQVNEYLLDCKLRLSDRLTKTAIFPREGMSLPAGNVYVSAENNTASLVENQ